MCRLSDAELNWVRTKMRLYPELRQLEMGISINLYLPARGTAGFERLAVRGYNLDPAPPPRMTQRTSRLRLRMRGAWHYFMIHMENTISYLLSVRYIGAPVF